MLVEDDELVSDEVEVAEIFNKFFSESTQALEITENKLLLNPVGDQDFDVDKCIKMFENHPSVLSIKKHVQVESEFEFLPVIAEHMEKKIIELDTKKNAGCIPTKILKQVRDIISQPLASIWNQEMCKK